MQIWLISCIYFFFFLSLNACFKYQTIGWLWYSTDIFFVSIGLQFFLKTGTCKFGKNCKYHHSRDRQDSQLLQFNILGLPIRKVFNISIFLSFKCLVDGISVSIICSQDEKSCPYYMRTRSCKFGVTCKFNHPQPDNTTAYTGSSAPTPVPYSVGLPLCFSRPPFMLSPGLDGLPYYLPLILPPTLLTMPIQQGWSTYSVSHYFGIGLKIH